MISDASRIDAQKKAMAVCPDPHLVTPAELHWLLWATRRDRETLEKDNPFPPVPVLEGENK